MTDDQVKVVPFGPDGEVETPWATALGGDLYELDNTPWFAYGVSLKDIIEARPRAPGEFPEFVRVVRKGGYRTVRVLLNEKRDQSAKSQAVLDSLKALGCRYEDMNGLLIGVDIPPSADLMAVRAFLIATGLEWEHADPELENLDLQPPRS